MKLSTLLSGLEKLRVEGDLNREIVGVTDDSRRVREGMLFVAISGSTLDGHDFVNEAIERGAAAVVVSKGFTKKLAKTTIFAENTRKALAELCANFHNHPEKKLKIVAVTGTKGKTTTLYTLYQILRGVGVKSISVGTLGVLGLSGFDISNTTPPPTVLFEILSRALSRGITTVLLEASSQALKDFRLYKIPFFAVALTGVGIDHIGGVEHESFEDYLCAKLSLFTEFSYKHALVNLDTELAERFLLASPKAESFGYCAHAEHKLSDFCVTPWESDFLLDGVRVKTSLLGIYNSYNVALALLLANKLSRVPIKRLAPLVSNIEVPGRFCVHSVLGRRVIIDYAHNGDSLAALSDLVRTIFSGRIIAVFGSVGGRGYERRRELAAAAEKYADLSVITTDNPEHESPLAIASEIYSYFEDKERACVVVDREQAIRQAIGHAEVGDTVLLLGKGHEGYMKVGNKKIPFCEREILEKIVNEGERAGK